MVHWREEYFAALAVRDESEKANISLYDACMWIVIKHTAFFPSFLLKNSK